MSNWNKIFKPIVVLCAICIIITGALAATNGVTAPIIEAATLAAQEAARTELLPEATGFTKVEGVNVENVADVYASDNNVGTVITSSAKGYGGSMTVMVAFNPDATVKQIKVTEQAETAGLGAKIQTEKSFLESFAGLPAEDFAVTDINAISGATISSKAVTAAVNAAIEKFGADTLILGCTHFPIIADCISRVLPGVTLINSGREAARALAAELPDAAKQGHGTLTCYVSDNPENFRDVASLFLGERFDAPMCKINIESY